MLATIFVLGGIWFWTLVAFEVMWLLWCVSEEEGYKAFASVAIFLVLIHLLGDASMLSWIQDNPIVLFKNILLYIGIGVTWSVCKFYFTLCKTKREIKELRKTFGESSDSVDATGDDNKNNVSTRWVFYVRKHYEDQHRFNYSKENPLDFKLQYDRILFWMTYWPLSMFWTILNDPITRFFKWLYHEVLIGLFRKMHDSIIGNELKY